MIIREANKFDLPEVVDMLRNFRGQTPIDMMKECNNEECNVKYYSEHLAYFKKDIIN